MLSANYFFGLCAVVFSLFPWVSFGVFSLDSQPWSILAFSFYLIFFVRDIVFPFEVLVAFLIFYFGLFFALLSTFDPGSLYFIGRGVFNYVGFFVVFLGFYNFILRYSFPDKIFKFSIVIWLLGALVEISMPSFMSLIAPIRTSAGRGLTSFAPEPTFFAIFLFFVCWTYLVSNSYCFRKSYVVIGLCVFGIVFLAESSMGVLFISLSVFSLFSYFLFQLKLTKLNFFILAITISSFFLFDFIDGFNSDSRMAALLQELFSVGIASTFYLDPSMNHRLEHIVFSIHGFFANFFWPGGFESFGELRKHLVSEYEYFFWHGSETNKIMSWVGDWVYQLGVFGLFSLFFVFYGAADKTIKRYFELSLLAIILLSAIPVASPLVPMLMASFYAKNRNLKVVN